MVSRLDQLQSALAASGGGVMALGPGPHMHWVLGMHPHPDERPCLLLVTPDAAAFLLPALHATGIAAQHDLALFTWRDEDGPEVALTQALTTLGASHAHRLLLDETMRADFALLMVAALPDAARELAAPVIAPLRMFKDAAEQQALRHNASIADEAMEAGFIAMREGLAECDIAEAIRAVFAERGARQLFAIVGAGANSAQPHHATDTTEIAAHMPVLLDIGGASGAFSSDITRMACLGQPPQGYEDVHTVVEAAVQAALGAARPGAPACAVDQAARAVIEAAGFGPRFPHRTGHGLGLEAHEPPWITASAETPLAPGMVFTIEPGIYLPGRFGVRLEEVVIIRQDGPEVLSRLPRAVRVL